jgi:HEAT repeat protein
LANLGDVLISKRKHSGDRRAAANELGENLAHKYGIPAIVAVLRDPSDDADVRQKCVLALSRIGDERVVDCLIDALLDHNLNVATQAEVQLRKVTGQRFEQDFKLPPPGTEARRTHQERWRKWWEDNRARVVIREALGTS